MRYLVVKRVRFDAKNAAIIELGQIGEDDVPSKMEDTELLTVDPSTARAIQILLDKKDGKETAAPLPHMGGMIRPPGGLAARSLPTSIQSPPIHPNNG